jgi:hypothetical protein
MKRTFTDYVKFVKNTLDVDLELSFKPKSFKFFGDWRNPVVVPGMVAANDNPGGNFGGGGGDPPDAPAPDAPDEEDAGPDPPIVPAEPQPQPPIAPIIPDEPQPQPPIAPIIPAEPQPQPPIAPIIPAEPQPQPQPQPAIPPIVPAIPPIVPAEPQPQPQPQPQRQPPIPPLKPFDLKAKPRRAPPIIPAKPSNLRLPGEPAQPQPQQAVVKVKQMSELEKLDKILKTRAERMEELDEKILDIESRIKKEGVLSPSFFKLDDKRKDLVNSWNDDKIAFDKELKKYFTLKNKLEKSPIKKETPTLQVSNVNPPLLPQTEGRDPSALPQITSPDGRELFPISDAERKELANLIRNFPSPIKNTQEQDMIITPSGDSNIRVAPFTPAASNVVEETSNPPSAIKKTITVENAEEEEVKKELQKIQYKIDGGAVYIQNIKNQRDNIEKAASLEEKSRRAKLVEATVELEIRYLEDAKKKMALKRTNKGDPLAEKYKSLAQMKSKLTQQINKLEVHLRKVREFIID